MRNHVTELVWETCEVTCKVLLLQTHEVQDVYKNVMDKKLISSRTDSKWVEHRKVVKAEPVYGSYKNAMVKNCATRKRPSAFGIPSTGL